MERYIGHTVEVIYVDKEGRFTQRTITVREVADGWVSAFCHTRGAPRRFRREQVLAVRSAPHPRAITWRTPAAVAGPYKHYSRTAG